MSDKRTIALRSEAVAASSAPAEVPATAPKRDNLSVTMTALEMEGAIG
ncbi:hypothetical protein QJ043_00485 [Olsenella sp. YH-ols2217]|uniref:Uncharacterized protein n=1 Tax=Kribbibacterium absianum TaxID=3044210 RepID=A0ABT6ZHQ5_9ACTN|nr:MULTISPECIES: hypothetical protein [unclassified Olsenella]MDJ1121073.1 hypothetical protein [Olsenella sp. YH-ols2216]MDJ1128564.1 hypothetical protein [Olsenella sp. YH-ols2217]